MCSHTRAGFVSPIVVGARAWRPTCASAGAAPPRQPRGSAFWSDEFAVLRQQKKEEEEKEEEEEREAHAASQPCRRLPDQRAFGAHCPSAASSASRARAVPAVRAPSRAAPRAASRHALSLALACAEERKRGREEEGGARAAPGARAHARLRAHPMVVSQGRQRRPVGRGRTTPAPRGARRVCRPRTRPPPRPALPWCRARCALKNKPRCCSAKAVIRRVRLQSGAIRAPSHRPALRAPKSHPAKRTAPDAKKKKTL